MAASPIVHNLDPRQRARHFFGYEAERADILCRLAGGHRQWIYAIEGLGATGKTALALDLAWSIVERQAPCPFHAVVWLSAREPALVPIGPYPAVPRPASTPHTLARICGTVARVLDAPHLTAAAEQEPLRQLDALRDALAASPTLLVLDDLDQLSPTDEIAIRDLLHHLPEPSKALVTARRYQELPFPLRLSGMGDAEMGAVIRRECDALRIQVSAEQRRRVAEWARGLPFAALVALRRVQALDADQACAELADGPAELARGIFAPTLDDLRAAPESSAALLTLAQATPAADLSLREVQHVLNLDGDRERCEELLAPLLRANLVTRAERAGRTCFTMLPLLRWYLTIHLS